MDFLDELRTFERIAHAGSLSAAARDMRMGTAGVSRRLDELEARLGVRLVHRSTRGLALTTEGVTALEQARALLDSADSLQDMFRDRRDIVTGRLHVAAPSRFGQRYVLPAVEAFLTKHERADVALHLSDRYQDLVAEGLDLAVRVGNSPDSTYLTRRIAVSERVVCAAPGYLARNGTPASPEELADHACLVPGDMDVWAFQCKGRTTRVKVAPRVRCYHGDVVAELCLRGLGVALKSLWDVWEEIAAGKLVRLLPDHTVEGDAHVSVLLPGRRFVPPRVRAFIGCLQATIGDPPVWQAAAARTPRTPSG